jgi:hypothetical protein
MTYGKWILPLALIAAGPIGAAPAGEKQIASIDLRQPFGTRSLWRFTATQGPDVPDDIIGGEAPGPIRLCISKDQGRTCSPDLREPLHAGSDTDEFDTARYLRDSRIVRPGGAAARALLLINYASLNSGDGDQRVGMQLFAYDRATDRFSRVFEEIVGHNNNQEIRYVEAGPLRGDVIVAVETGDAPFGFWVTVNRLNPAFIYKQVLRFRSATHYGDGNPLAVIDSEMPNIQQRLGLWRPGKPLPAPKGCAKPRLVKMELWC